MRVLHADGRREVLDAKIGVLGLSASGEPVQVVQ